MVNEPINWKEQTEKYKEAFLEDLVSILKIDSVRDDSKATEEFPVGPGPAEALKAFLEIGKRDGFKTEQFKNWAGHIEYGTGDEIMGVFGHVDVVPTGTGWETNPFDPVIKDERIYARGSSDDKGPSMAAYYALKMIKDIKLPVSKKIRIILGTDEESDWQGVKHYFNVSEKPDFGFAPDAMFPIINGEKGNFTVKLEIDGTNEGPLKLVSFESGLRPNMVPQDAQTIIEAENEEEIKNAFEEFILNQPVKGSAEIDGAQLKISVVGQSAHGSTPEKGVNAATYLAAFLNGLDFGKGAKTFTKVISDYLHEDPKGEKLNIAYTDDIMGSVSSNSGVFSFVNGETASITVNMRYPQGTDEQIIEKQFNETLKEENITIIPLEGKVPHYVPDDDPLVKTLLDVYHRQTGLEAHEQVIGGGTYGRLLERGVAYGAMFPDSIDTMHQANEFMALEDLYRAISIYAEAIYELIK